MADLGRTFALNRNTPVWVVEEASYATEGKPMATDAVRIISGGQVSQPRPRIPNPERIFSLSRPASLLGAFNPGSVGFDIFLKPPGTAGAKPEGAAILKALFGREKVTANTSVVYELLKAADFLGRPSCTVWILDSHLLFRCAGTYFSQGTGQINSSNDEAGQARMSVQGICSQIRYTGTSELTAAAAANATEITVSDGTLYDPGECYIKVGDDATEHKVTKVVGNVLTISPVLAADAAKDALVKPSVPSHTSVGVPVSGRLGVATLSDSPYSGTHGYLPTETMQWSLNNNLEFILTKPEQTGDSTLYPRLAADTGRDVGVSFGIPYTAEAARLFDKNRKGGSSALVVPAGDEAGKILEISCPKIEYQYPDRGDQGIRRLGISGDAAPTAGSDDELKLTFK